MIYQVKGKQVSFQYVGIANYLQGLMYETSTERLFSSVSVVQEILRTLLTMGGISYRQQQTDNQTFLVTSSFFDENNTEWLRKFSELVYRDIERVRVQCNLQYVSEKNVLSTMERICESCISGKLPAFCSNIQQTTMEQLTTYRFLLVLMKKENLY